LSFSSLNQPPGRGFGREGRRRGGRGKESPSIFLILFTLIVCIRSLWVFLSLWKSRKGGEESRNFLAEIGVLYLLIYTAVVTSFFDYGENMRFKFMVEPLFFAYLVFLLYGFIRRGRKWRKG